MLVLVTVYDYKYLREMQYIVKIWAKKKMNSEKHNNKVCFMVCLIIFLFLY